MKRKNSVKYLVESGANIHANQNDALFQSSINMFIKKLKN